MEPVQLSQEKLDEIAALLAKHGWGMEYGEIDEPPMQPDPDENGIVVPEITQEMMDNRPKPIWEQIVQSAINTDRPSSPTTDTGLPINAVAERVNGPDVPVLPAATPNHPAIGTQQPPMPLDPSMMQPPAMPIDPSMMQPPLDPRMDIPPGAMPPAMMPPGGAQPNTDAIASAMMRVPFGADQTMNMNPIPPIPNSDRRLSYDSVLSEGPGGDVSLSARDINEELEIPGAAGPQNNAEFLRTISNDELVMLLKNSERLNPLDRALLGKEYARRENPNAYEAMTGESIGLPERLWSYFNGLPPDGKEDFIEEYNKAQAAGDGKPSAAEAKIRRLMGMVNPLTGQPYTRNEATVAAEYYELSNDGQVIDKRSGGRVTTDTVEVPEAVNNYNSTSFADGAWLTTGAPGFVANAVNSVFDAAFITPASPEALAATTALGKLNNTAIEVFSVNVDGRPTNFSRELVQETLPEANSIFQGPERTKSKAYETAGMAANMLKDLATIINGNGYTPKQRSDAKALYPKVRRLFEEYDGLYKALDGRDTAPDEAPPAASPWQGMSNAELKKVDYTNLRGAELDAYLAEVERRQ